MAASLLMAASFFVGRVRRLSKGWSFAATQSSGDSAYSPKCGGQVFSEVRPFVPFVAVVVTLGRR